MRLKRNELQQIFVCPAVCKKDGEGTSILSYEPPSGFLHANVWPGGGAVQAEIYGSRLGYIRNLQVDGPYEAIPLPDGRVQYRVEGIILEEKMGLCIHVPEGKPDYRIISIVPEQPLYMVAEKI